MSQELGRITRPEVDSFKARRRLFLVPLIYSFADAPAEYVEKFELYWKQVDEHIANLEAKLGRVTCIYHESLSAGGEEGLKVLEKLNPRSCEIARQRCRDGARLEALEDRELVAECLDWERCLLMGLASEAAVQKVTQFYMEAARRRYEHISKRIDETVGEGDVAVLFIREGHMVQFPKDMDVFSVAPPALDEVHRWLRDHSGRTRAKAEDNKRAEEQDRPADS